MQEGITAPLTLPDASLLAGDGDAETASRDCAASATAEEAAPAVDAGPAASAPDSVVTRHPDAGAGLTPQQNGAAARQKPPSGPVVPGHVTLAGQRVRPPLFVILRPALSVSRLRGAPHEHHAGIIGDPARLHDRPASSIALHCRRAAKS